MGIAGPGGIEAKHAIAILNACDLLRRNKLDLSAGVEKPPDQPRLSLFDSRGFAVASPIS
jgi:hypothetical protein